jgi:serine phosphatase RsbU (regulator of sigma subunit)
MRPIAESYGLDNESVLQTFAEFQAIGMVTISGNFTAIVQSPNPKAMKEAYEIRAALEEIAGRTAAANLRGNTAALENELDAMRASLASGDSEAFAEHDALFHRTIVQASENEVLLRVWETLAVELRIRAVIGKVLKDLPEIVESHQPIIDALASGRGREAGVLLRNHVETLVEYLKKSESDSGLHKVLRRDLEGAKDVQKAFFPPKTLSIPCLSCETFYQPVHEIGGDYYDILSLEGGRWGIAIGDVSGKGIGAALIMASLQASLRAQALRPHVDLSALVQDVNRLVFESSPKNFFASLFYAEYEPAARTLKYVNAGHNPPIVVRTGQDSCELFRLNSSGMPVGVASDTSFPSATFQLQVGDIFVAYTDGITEAEGPHGEFWGFERLEALLRSCGTAGADEVIQRILTEVSAFVGTRPQRDDMTLVVMDARPGCDV